MLSKEAPIKGVLFSSYKHVYTKIQCFDFGEGGKFSYIFLLSLVSKGYCHLLDTGFFRIDYG